MGKHYTFDCKDKPCVKAWAGMERVHFKPMFETGRAIKGMNAQKAVEYLENVIAHKRAVPFFRYNEGITHHSQGHEWGCPQSRWPEKSCKLFIKLLKNALANTSTQPDLKPENLIVAHVQVNRAQQYRYRRIHQAHGRVKCYASPPTNVQIVLAEPSATTPAAK